MLKCDGCGKQEWRRVWTIKDSNDEPEQLLVQCENCKRLIVTETLEGDGSI